MILKNILIIDGSFMLHRCLKQQNIFNMRSSSLERTGGIYGVLNIFQKELKLAGNYFPIFCWDDGQSDRRLFVDDNYKKHREKLSDPNIIPFSQMTDEQLDEDYVYNYKLQRKKLIEVLNSFGVPNLLFKHTEGDDLMYWLSKHSESSKVLTDDKDLLQLLNENCIVRQPMKDKLININDFLKENSFNSIYDFVKNKALLGDPSDNIPSACYMVGEKSTKDFFNVYEKLKESNQLEIINDEIKLKDYCKNNDLKFKKAFCNFDENRYLKNLELVDLNRIHNDEFNEELIYDKIKNVYKNNDIHKTMNLLKQYEIKTINTNVIFESLVMSRHNIKE